MPKGKVYFVELKRPDGKLSKLQRSQINFLRELGHRAVVLSSINEVDDFCYLIEHEGAFK